MIKRLMGIAALLLCTPWAYAEHYYFAQGIDGARFASGSAACSAYLQNNQLSNLELGELMLLQQGPTTYSGDIAYYCKFREFNKVVASNTREYTVVFTRYGDSCPAGKIYNDNKGRCDIEGLKTPEQCAAQSNETAFELDYKDYAISTCVLGCHAKDALLICNPDPNHPCRNRTIVNYTGAYCDGEDHDKPPSAGSPEAPDNPDNSDNPNNPPPPGQGDNTSPPTDAASGNDNGGSNHGSNNNGGNGDNGGNGSGSGTVPGNGGGGKGGNSGAKGDCPEGQDCKDKESKVGGESCDADLICEGDAIQCALLKQQKKQYCQWQEDGEKEAQLKGTLEGWADEEKNAFEGNSEEIPVSNLFNDAVNAGRWLASSCPAPKAMHVFGKSIYLSWEPLCKFAEWMAPIIVLLASLFFAITVAKAIKGN